VAWSPTRCRRSWSRPSTGCARRSRRAAAWAPSVWCRRWARCTPARPAVEQARHECLTVVVSIFVNPLQFDRADDLARYPRPFDADLALCAKLGVDVVFAPTPAVMYPQPPDCTVHVGRTAEHLCGAFRPGHFDGVATVVLKLLNIVQPDAAYFGERDASSWPSSGGR
jgi:pantoate--beta-alanine ligase